MAKAPLVLIVFTIVSVLLTATAAWLAMHRPDVERLNVETRSRLSADYSVDAVARRLEPLNPDIIRAAAQDEGALLEQQTSTQPPRRVEPVDVTPVATVAPTGTPRPGATAPGATGTAPPGVTGTAKPGSPSATAGPSTPQPTGTPPPGATALPTVTVPVPTVTLPTATIDVPTLVPTLIPTLVPTLVPTLPPTNTPVPPTNTPQPTSTPVPTSTLAPTSTPAPSPTPTPTSIVGQILNSLSCTVLGTLGSPPGGAATTITFANQSGGTVRIYELKPLGGGAPTLRATLPDGQQTTLNTNVGKAFEVRDAGNDCIAVFVAIGQPGYAEID